MRFSFSLLSVVFLAFVFIYSCSSEEEDSTAPPLVQYTLTVSASEGGIVSTEGGAFDEGTEVTITATPNEGYFFVGWEGNSSTNENLSIILESNTSLTAIFQELNTTEVNNDPNIFHYDTTKSYEGELVNFYPSAFFAGDVPAYIRGYVNIALKAAADEFGKYGPTELWSVGTSEVAAADLAGHFCERRIALNQTANLGDSKSDCLSQREERFLNRASVGRESIMNNECRVDGSHSGGFDWGIHYLNTTYLLGFDNDIECRPFGDDFFTIIHEYYHVVQNASVYSLNREERNKRTKPNDAIWMMEGAAQYMGIYTVYKLQNEGSTIFQTDKWTQGLRNGMKNVMVDGKYHFALCPEIKFSQIKGSDNCRQAAYSLGAWAVAYLIDRTNNQNILLDSFYPNLASLGFNGAFNFAFGYSPSEFYEEFDAFLQLPIEQQLEIISDI